MGFDASVGFKGLSGAPFWLQVFRNREGYFVPVSKAEQPAWAKAMGL